MKVDLIFPCKNRPEFSRASLAALIANTDFDLVKTLYFMTDGGTEEGIEARDQIWMRSTNLDKRRYGGPVAITNRVIEHGRAPFIAKIDNDVIVPPGWLNQCVRTLELNPYLGILGLEPPESRTANPQTGRVDQPPEYTSGSLAGVPPAHFAVTDCVGGVFVARRSAFEGRALPVPNGFNGVGGFTGWQQQNTDVVKGWIVPPLKLFLLDRLPMDPWRSLSDRYESEGDQRPWTKYDAGNVALWSWWDGGR